MSGDRWGGVFDSEARENYLAWKRRMESITYTFTNEIDKLILHCEKLQKKFEDVFENSNQHPIILKLYLNKKVSIETLVILNKLNNFTDKLDLLLSSDLIWPDTSRIIKKYSPFISIDKEKYAAIIRTRLGHSFGTDS